MFMLHAAVLLSQAEKRASFRRGRTAAMDGASLKTRCAPQIPELLVSLYALWHRARFGETLCLLRTTEKEQQMNVLAH